MGQSLLEDNSEIKPYEIKPPYPQQFHQTRAMAHTLLLLCQAVIGVSNIYLTLFINIL